MRARGLRVAVWQCGSLPGDIAGNLARLATAAERVDADVLVTPEMFLTGYDVGAVPGLDPAGPEFAAVAEVTRRTGVAIAYGYPEALPGGGIANAAQLVDGGTSVGRYRKAHLFGDLDATRFAPGSDFPVFELRGRTVGMLICFDVEHPEAVRALAAAGAEVVLVPTANMAEYPTVSTALVPAHAREAGVAIAYANYSGTEGALDYAGLSTIVGPDGSALVLAAADGEALLAAEV